MIEYDDKVLFYTPKRMISLWKELASSCVQLFYNGRIENMDDKQSAIWKEIDGETTIQTISTNTSIEIKDIINILLVWKEKRYIIFNYDSLSPTQEKDTNHFLDLSLIRADIDVLFFVPPSPHANTRTVATSNLYPLGIGYLMSIIERDSNYTFDAVNAWNENLDEENIEKIFSIARPKVVGISTMTDNYQNGLKIAQIAKKLFPQIIVFMGGPHATFRGPEILNNNLSIDYVLQGESEKVIVPLLNAILAGNQNMEDIEGLVYRGAEGIVQQEKAELITELDTIPFPKRGTNYFTNMDEVGIITSRGCPGRCIFCCASSMSGCKYRMRSPENVIAEIKDLVNRGAKRISIIDDTFTVSISRMYRILDLIKEAKFQNVSFSAESRVDVVSNDKKIFSELFSAGFKTIQFGVESGSQDILNKLNKRITVEQILVAVSLAAQSGLVPYCTLLIGHPFETNESINDSISFAKQLIDLGAAVFFSVVTPYPGSDIGDHPNQYGIKILSDSYDQYSTNNPIIDIPHMNRSSIRKAFYDATLEIAKYFIKTRQRQNNHA